MERARIAGLILRVDAVANLGLAVALAAGAGPVGHALGVSRTWLLVVAVVLVVNGALCWGALRDPQPARLRSLATIDGIFGAAMLALAVLNPGDAAPHTRWLLAALGDVVLVVGGVKLWCAQVISDPALLSQRRVAQRR